MKGVIYCYHCILTGKKYIGQTRNEKKRKNNHLYSAIYTKENNKFYNAIRKYGWENFIYGIIGEYDLQLLDENEIFYIKKYNTITEGYNTIITGKYCNKNYVSWNTGMKNCYKLSEKTKKRMSENRQNRKWWNNGEEESWSQNPPDNRWELGRLENNLEKAREGAIKSSIKYLLEVTNPSGEKFITNNVREFCRENNLCRAGFCRIIKGEYPDYKGWTVRILEHLR